MLPGEPIRKIKGKKRSFRENIVDPSKDKVSISFPII